MLFQKAVTSDVSELAKSTISRKHHSYISPIEFSHTSRLLFNNRPVSTFPARRNLPDLRLSKSTKVNSSWAANSCSGILPSYMSQCRITIYSVHNSMPLVHVITKPGNPAHTFISNLRSVLILFALLRLNLVSGRFSSCFSVHVSHLFSMCHMSHPPQPPSLNHPDHISSEAVHYAFLCGLNNVSSYIVSPSTTLIEVGPLNKQCRSCLRNIHNCAKPWWHEIPCGKEFFILMPDRSQVFSYS